MNGDLAPLQQRVLYRLCATPAPRGTTLGFVSGAQLSEALGVSRTAIWKAVGTLRELGVHVESLPRQGYRLASPCTPLSADALRAALPAITRARLHELRVRWRTTSTNQDLLERGAPPPGRFDLHVAETQSAGRGRRGRSWVAPPGGALCLSWSWRFEGLPPHAGTLSLAIGLAAVRSLEALGITGVKVKWPNDLVATGGKLAGILIETVSEAGGPAMIVVGLGLNVALSNALRRRIATSGNAATDLQTLVGNPPTRVSLAARLVADGVDALLRWEAAGFAPLVDEWRAHDALVGRPVAVLGAARVLNGVARGVDEEGALLIDDGTKTHRCVAGEVSVRTA